MSLLMSMAVLGQMPNPPKIRMMMRQHTARVFTSDLFSELRDKNDNDLSI